MKKTIARDLLSIRGEAQQRGIEKIGDGHRFPGFCSIRVQEPQIRGAAVLKTQEKPSDGSICRIVPSNSSARRPHSPVGATQGVTAQSDPGSAAFEISCPSRRLRTEMTSPVSAYTARRWFSSSAHIHGAPARVSVCQDQACVP